MTERISSDFFAQRAITGAPSLLGKILCRKVRDSGINTRVRITETECYMGEEDGGCHAHNGKTKRNSVLYQAGGVYYVYLCYGMHNLLNVVFGSEGSPEAALIRGGIDVDTGKKLKGPGILTKYMRIDRDMNNVTALGSKELWIENDGFKNSYISSPRVGIDYAPPEWRDVLWRFIVV